MPVTQELTLNIEPLGCELDLTCEYKLHILTDIQVNHKVSWEEV